MIRACRTKDKDGVVRTVGWLVTYKPGEKTVSFAERDRWLKEARQKLKESNESERI